MPDRTLLTEAQHRHLSVSLALVADELADALAGSDASVPTGVFTRVENDLSAKHDALLRSEIAGISQQLTELAERFHLAEKIVSRRHKIAALLSAAWTQLHDCMSSKMRGYGTVDSQLSAKLDSDLLTVIKRVERLQFALERLENDD
ncbi:MAG: hypothetical protein ACE5HT_14250 [Gemmatimonadales bacterium]